MIKNKKSKYIKSCLLVVSTLPFLLFYSAFLYFIPALYVSFVVPYLIWRIWAGKDNQRTRKYSLIWKIPLIIFLAIAMFHIEIVLIFIFAIEIPLIGKIIIFVFLLFLLRCLTYAIMIFIWQPNILKSYYKVWGYVGVILYCIANSYFIYSIKNAPDTDDYNIPFSEYLK